MAGIGWKLERMIAKGTLSSTFQAYLTGVAITSAPWLLTTAVLVTLRLLARGHAGVDLAQVEMLITLAYAMTLVLSAPIHVVVSRYVADRLYERRLAYIAEPLRRALTGTMLGFLAIGGGAVAIVGTPIELGVPTAMLTATIAGEWLLLGAGGSMSVPAGVLAAFAIGSVTSVLAAVGLERGFGLGARGYLCGFTLGQGVALLLMLSRVLRDLPAQETRVSSGTVRGAFREYRLLALSAFLVHAAVWGDKLCAWLVAGAQSARTLASASALAWFAVIPAFAWIYIQVETTFYRAFRGYYGGIESGARLHELEAAAARIRHEATRLVRGAIVIQLSVLTLAELSTPTVVAGLGLPSATERALQYGLVGASLQVLSLLGLLFVYYLDLRRTACLIAIAQLASIAAATLIATALGAPPAAGAAVGALVPAVLAVATVRRAVTSIVPDTFQSQPYGA